MFSPTPRLCATSSTVRSPRPSSNRTASALNSAVYRFLFKFFFDIQQTLYRRDDLPAGCPLIRRQLTATQSVLLRAQRCKPAIYEQLGLMLAAFNVIIIP